MTNRPTDYIYTYTGKKFYIEDPRPEDISIEDIAHALANQGRFNGHSPEYYSVAQHCVLVSELVSKENALWGLLHDASEAYLPDIPTPFKKHVKEFRELEESILRPIIESFGLEWPEPLEVDEADKLIVVAEADNLWGEGNHPIVRRGPKLELDIYPWSPEEAEYQFMERYDEIRYKGR